MTTEQPVECACGGKSTWQYEYMRGDWVVCQKCNAQTPYCDDETTAVKAWNRMMEVVKGA